MNMGTCVCACGAKYRFAEKVSGRQARCKRCGEALTLGAGSSGVPETAKLPSAVKPVFPPQEIPSPIIEIEFEEDAGLPWQSGPERGYWNALLWSSLFPSSIHNLAAFLTLWAVFGFLNCVPLPRISIFYFVSFLWVAVWLWYAAFRVGVVESAANGHFRLPDVEITSDFWGDLLDPALRWYGSWLMVMVPALIYATAQGYRGINVIADTWQALTNPALPGVPGPAVDLVLVSLALVGLFFWPMVVLTVIIGGFGYLWRIDRILLTFVNSLVPYFVTVVVVAFAFATLILNEIYLSPPLWSVWRSATMGALGVGLLQRVLAAGVEVYVWIVAARAIGLYFRHFGHRFAWDWGQNEV